MKLSQSICVLAVVSPTMAFTTIHSPSLWTQSKSPVSLQALTNQRHEQQDMEYNSDDNDNVLKPKHYFNPTPVFMSAISKHLTPTALTSTALAAFLALSLTFASPDAAWAARSGGRMGGSFGSAAPSMRSMPSRSSYSGGGGGYYRGGGRPIIAPIIAPTPFVTPFYGGGYGGAGVLAVPRGPSFFDLLFFGGFAFVALSAFTSAARGIATSGTDLWTDSTASVLGPGVTVAKMSVALDVPNRDDRGSILNVLDQLARTAKTDNRVGIQNLTSQVALELLRRKSSIVSAYSKSSHYNDKGKAQREFSSTAIQERGKFEQETVSRYGGVDYGTQRSGATPSEVSGKATKAVVTLIFAIDGDSTKLPNIGSISDVEEALRRIASDAKVEECLQSAEILWTPEDRSETLTSRDVVADYPELRSV